VSVRVHADTGLVSDWSAAAAVEAGMLDPLDWVAFGIAQGWDEDGTSDTRRPPLFRRDFDTTGAIAFARLYASAHGVYEVEINGQRVGADILNPGWTVYPERLRYHTYDVTDYLTEGGNAIGAWLGDGWWRGRIGFAGGTANIYGSDISLLAQLEITYTDGSRQIVATDEKWRSTPSPILSSSLYQGETFDEGENPSGFSSAGFDDEGWWRVRPAAFANGTLVAPDGPPVRCTDELSPVSMERTSSGAILLDFGQNHSGRLRVRAVSGVGEELLIRHAEILQDGELYVRTLREAISEDRYRGSTGSIDWEPRFTIHGYRYAEITGFEGDLADLDVVSRVYHSDMRRTGWLETSDASVNRLHNNVLWSMRSNFVDIPMDCPQRDERLGWTGDIQVFAATASYLYDVSGFLSSWLKDLAVEQRRFGTAPWFVPVVPGGFVWNPVNPGAAWGDAAALTPWALFERFADTDILVRQYSSARAWVDQVERIAGPDRLWDSGLQLGDWLDPNAPPESPADAMTDRYLVATAFFARSADRVARAAAQLGDTAAAEHYTRLSGEVREAFLRRWCTGDGILAEGTQTAYALALEFDLFTGATARQRAGDALATLVRDNGYRIGSGFAGVNLVADALTHTGHVDDAFGMLMERQTPSWMSMVDKGATTIWERWDSLLDDGTVNSGEMTSFNHYALGSIADWMQRTIGGIQPIAPGYRSIRIAPVPAGGLTSAQARFLSAYGEITSEWEYTGDSFSLTVTIPVGVHATVCLPDGEEIVVSHGTHSFEQVRETVPVRITELASPAQQR